MCKNVILDIAILLKPFTINSLALKVATVLSKVRCMVLPHITTV